MKWVLMGNNNPWVKAQGQRYTAGPPLQTFGEQIVSGLSHRYSEGRPLDVLSDHHSNRNSICKPSCQIEAYSLGMQIPMLAGRHTQYVQLPNICTSQFLYMQDSGDTANWDIIRHEIFGDPSGERIWLYIVNQAGKGPGLEQMDLNTSTSTLCKVLVRQTLLCVLSKGSGYQNYNT